MNFRLGKGGQGGTEALIHTTGELAFPPRLLFFTLSPFLGSTSQAIISAVSTFFFYQV